MDKQLLDLLETIQSSVDDNPLSDDEKKLADSLFRFIISYNEATIITQNDYCRIDCLVLSYFLLFADVYNRNDKQSIMFRIRFRTYLALKISQKYNLIMDDLNVIFNERIEIYEKIGKEDKNHEIFYPFEQIILNDIQENTLAHFSYSKPAIICEPEKAIEIQTETGNLIAKMLGEFLNSFCKLSVVINEPNKKTNNKTSKRTYCKKCGGELDDSRKCMKCQTQYFYPGRFINKKIVAVLLLLVFIASIGANIYLSVNVAQQNDTLTQTKVNLSDTKKELSDANKTIENNKKRISQLYQTNSELLKSNQQSKDDAEMLSWYKDNVAIIYNYDKEYYHYACCNSLSYEDFVASKKLGGATYFLYTTESAIADGYKPCPNCIK